MKTFTPRETITYTLQTDGTGRVLELTRPMYWTRVKLILETAGPVAVSTKQSFTPVLSGQGILLPTGQEIEIILQADSTLFYAAESINRVKVIQEPVPWLEEIFLRLVSYVK